MYCNIILKYLLLIHLAIDNSDNQNQTLLLNSMFLLTEVKNNLYLSYKNILAYALTNIKSSTSGFILLMPYVQHNQVKIHCRLDKAHKKDCINC